MVFVILRSIILGNWKEKDLKEFAQAWFMEGWQAGEAITILDVGTYFERCWKKINQYPA